MQLEFVLSDRHLMTNCNNITGLNNNNMKTANIVSWACLLLCLLFKLCHIIT